MVNELQAYGGEVLDIAVLTKVLRKLFYKFDHVVTAIKESKDLDKLTIDELHGALLKHEVRINQSEGENDHKALQVKAEGSSVFNTQLSQVGGKTREPE